ncbi:hypothetical protein V8G54_035159 [Vigna mungo]|uniref:Uncharacterized protein n=1 Tax=Vigna mungo TaxID=3915 RepID=A0AAQ3MEY7_VIGMU
MYLLINPFNFQHAYRLVRNRKQLKDVIQIQKTFIYFKKLTLIIVPNLHIECHHLSPIHPPNMWLEICGFDTHCTRIHPKDIFLCEPGKSRSLNKKSYRITI